MNKKQLNKHFNKSVKKPGIILGFIVVAIVAVAAGAYAYRLRQEKTSQIAQVNPTPVATTSPTLEPTSTPTPFPEIVDEVKDGVYTNYTYGFRFEYDEELFPYNISTSPGTMLFSSKPLTPYGIYDIDITAPSISVSSNPITENEDTTATTIRYNELKQLQPGISLKNGLTNYVKKQSLRNKDIEIFVVHAETIPGSETEYFNADIIIFEKRGNLFSIWIEDRSNSLEKMSDMVNEIAYSIKFD